MERTSVKVPKDYFELAQNYLAKRIQELEVLNNAIAQSRFDEIRALSHKTKGTAASYGLRRLGELAAELERHSKNHDLAGAGAVFGQIRSYLKSVELSAE